MNRRSLFLPIAILPLALLFGFAPSPIGYKVGDTAMNVSLQSVDGKMVSFDDYKTAKGFIVVFTCNHCPFAKAYEDRIIALDNMYAPKGYPVIAISSNDASMIPDDSFTLMAQRAKEKKFPYPYLYDESQAVVNAYGATVTPHVFVLRKEHAGLVVKYIGAIDDNSQDASAATKHFVQDAVDALLAGKSIGVTQTKAIGCGIKFKKG